MKWKNITFTQEQMRDFLATLGFLNITISGETFRFSWETNANPTGTALFMNNLRWIKWTDGSSGDLLDLVKEKLRCSTKEAFKIIEDFARKKVVSVKDENDFSIVINDLSSAQYEERRYLTYPESVMEQYIDCVSKLFLDDGVGVIAQSFFGVRYDIESERVVFPVRDENGLIVGVLGRYNMKDRPKTIAKYLPLIHYQKHFFLFGMYENKDFINHSIILVESEKSVMKAMSLGYRNVLALGGVNINAKQLELIDAVNPLEVILALDEGVDEKHISKMVKVLETTNPFVVRDVGYLPSNDIGMKSKNCIFDEDPDTIDKLLEEVIWV